MLDCPPWVIPDDPIPSEAKWSLKMPGLPKVWFGVQSDYFLFADDPPVKDHSYVMGECGNWRKLMLGQWSSRIRTGKRAKWQPHMSIHLKLHFRMLSKTFAWWSHTHTYTYPLLSARSTIEKITHTKAKHRHFIRSRAEVRGTNGHLTPPFVTILMWMHPTSKAVVSNDSLKNSESSQIQPTKWNFEQNVRHWQTHGKSRAHETQ